MNDLQWGKLLQGEKNSSVDIVETMRAEADFWLSQAQESINEGAFTIMKDHEGDRKQYVLLSEARYAEANLPPLPPPAPKPYLRKVDNVQFGFYSPDGGSGEMSVNWYLLGEGEKPAPCFECWDDAWHALAQFKDVIDALAEVGGQDITPHEFCALLDRCGFVDATPRER